MDSFAAFGPVFIDQTSFGWCCSCLDLSSLLEQPLQKRMDFCQPVNLQKARAMRIWHLRDHRYHPHSAEYQIQKEHLFLYRLMTG